MPDGVSTATAFEGHRVLVLNPDHTPVAFPDFHVSWRRGLRMVVMEDVAFPLRQSGLVARSPSITMLVPSVVVLRKWYRARGLHGTAAFSLNNLYLRDRGRCMYTDRPLRLGAADVRERASIDHLKPKSVGGGKSWLNCVLASAEVNSRRGNLPPEQAGLRLKYEPWIPTCADLLSLCLSEESLRGVNPEWLEFLHRVKPSRRVLRVLDKAA
jgi:5-methylcytosine-specific restriction endonuclease McrA